MLCVFQSTCRSVYLLSPFLDLSLSPSLSLSLCARPSPFLSHSLTLSLSHSLSLSVCNRPDAVSIKHIMWQHLIHNIHTCVYLSLSLSISLSLYLYICIYIRSGLYRVLLPSPPQRWAEASVNPHVGKFNLSCDVIVMNIFLIRWLFSNEHISNDNHLIGRLPTIITSHGSFQSPIMNLMTALLSMAIFYTMNLRTGQTSWEAALISLGGFHPLNDDILTE